MTALLLAACSGGAATPSSPSVASIESPTRSVASASAASAAVGDDARPLLRPDSSNDDYVRLYRQYYDCLVEHGVPSSGDSGGTGKVPVDESNPAHRKALTACQSALPESLEDREKRQNPAAWADHNRQVIKCLRAHRIAIDVDGSGQWGLKPGVEGGDAMRACIRDAFVGR